MFTRDMLPQTARTLLLPALLGLAASAASAQVPAPPQQRPIALVGGTVHTVSGDVIENGTVVFDNGVITAVGRDVAIPAGAERIDVSGRHVAPGLIAAHSWMGLYEIGGFTQTIDLTELGPLNPNVKAEVAFNPESRHIGVARSNGVLVTVSSPAGGLISGLAAAMVLDGWTWEAMMLQPGAGLIVNWPSPATMSPWGGGGSGGRRVDPEQRYADQIRELRHAFAEARAYRTARRAAENGGGAMDTDPRWEAMIPVLDGEVPVLVNANEVRQIQDAITWAEEEGVRIVILGGRDAGYVADHLARKDVPVILTTVLSSPLRDWEPYDAVYSLPARLHRAGVKFAIAGGSTAAYAYRLPYEAGAAVAYGLPMDEALRAVTLYPARILGLDDRIGSIEPGKQATLIVTRGHPLEYEGAVERAFVQGRAIDMADAQRRFFEKYRQRLQQRPATAEATTN